MRVELFDGETMFFFNQLDTEFVLGRSDSLSGSGLGFAAGRGPKGLFTTELFINDVCMLIYLDFSRFPSSVLCRFSILVLCFI